MPTRVNVDINFLTTQGPSLEDFLFFIFLSEFAKIFKTGINFGELVRINKTSDLYMFLSLLTGTSSARDTSNGGHRHAPAVRALGC